MSSEQQVKNTIAALYKCYCDILQMQCGTPLEFMPPLDLFMTEQMEESRTCDVGKFLPERDKRRFCILAFWNLLGVAPNDEMLRSADTYVSTIENYQRDLIFSILTSQQFKENNVIATNIPWKGVQLYKLKLIAAMKSMCSFLPLGMQNKIAEIYRKRKRV